MSDTPKQKSTEIEIEDCGMIGRPSSKPGFYTVTMFPESGEPVELRLGADAKAALCDILVEAEYVKAVDFVNDDGPGYVEGAMLLIGGKSPCIPASALSTTSQASDVTNAMVDAAATVILPLVSSPSFTSLSAAPKHIASGARAWAKKSLEAAQKAGESL